VGLLLVALSLWGPLPAPGRAQVDPEAPAQARSIILGLVFDSVAMRPLAGASVSLARGQGMITSASEVTFRLEDVPPGEYSLVASHARLDSLGLTPLLRVVRVEPGRDARVTLAIPSLDTLWPLYCMLERPSGESGVLSGAVTDEISGVRQPLAEVRALWRDDSGTRRRVEALSGSDGLFTLCGVPLDRQVSLQAEFLDEVQASEVVTLGEEGVQFHDIVVHLSQPGRILGTIRDADTEDPIPSAVVTLLGTEHRTVTNGLGEFLLLEVDPGRYTLQIEHLAYGSQTREVALGSQTLQVDADFSREAIVLEGITVTARSRALEGEGYYLRERKYETRGATFLTGEEIMARDSSRLTVALRGIPRTRVRMDGPWGPALQPVTASSNCPMAVFWNGMWIPDGGLGLNNFDPAEIRAMEIYPYGLSWTSEPRFQPPGGWTFARRTALHRTCGVMLVWTK
jgi:hypothetical protein